LEYIFKNDRKINLALRIKLKIDKRIEKISDRAIAYAMLGITVDGTDAIKVYEAVKQAVEKAHSGGDPTLVELV